METRYQQVKNYLLCEIRNNRWRENERILSENELVTTCGVSRMTARRAIKELERDGILFSIRGKGTFVTPVKAQSSAVELRNIAEEVRSRNHKYSCRILSQERVEDSTVAKLFRLENNVLFHSIVVHLENDLPIQYEERYVNPLIAEDYLDINLADMTANEYLTNLCPVTSVEHQIEAVKATPKIAEQLLIAIADPCLKLTRMTRDRGQVISLAKLYHPGDRFMLGTEFKLQA